MVSEVDHPKHYTSHPSRIECITIVEHMSFNLGNAIKYIWRADHKGNTPLVDLQKARWYLDREIRRISASEHGENRAGQISADARQVRENHVDACGQDQSR